MAKEKEKKVVAILKRQEKKEKYANNFMKNKIFVNKEIKEKRDQRIQNALDKVKHDVHSHQAYGMEYYMKLLEEVDQRKE